MTRNRAIAAFTLAAWALPLGVVMATSDLERSAVESAPVIGSTPTPPTIVFIDVPSDDERAMVDWAIERYIAVGLQLPDLEISFPVTCGGKSGRYLIGAGRIELCRPTRKLVLHELAHAWDDQGVVDREAFMARRGLDHWYEQPAERSTVTGGEQLAQVLTWGLMDLDITWPSSEYAGQPVGEQPRALPGLDDSAPEVLTELFEEFTGERPLSPGRVAPLSRG